MQRRDMMTMIGGGVATVLVAPRSALSAVAAPFGGDRFAAAIDAVEARVGGRLGVAVLDLATGNRASHRGGERFPMCSTFKFPLSAAVLHASERGRLSLARAVPVRRADIIPNSPVTARHVGGSMTVVELCHATMTTSDNAAANLLLPLIGGVEGFNAFLRAIGDPTTRLDRIEPHLNSAIRDDPRDTTTPDCMLDANRAMLFGPALSSASRARLTGWLVANTTGGTRLRAGLPRSWRVGDKTGTCDTGANDVGVAWPAANRRPVLIASYLTGSRARQEAMYAAHADVARAVAAAIARG